MIYKTFFKSFEMLKDRKGYSIDCLITLEDRPTWFGRLIGCKSRELQFVGSCTVWRTYPDFVRVGLGWQALLCDIWHRERFRAEVEQGNQDMAAN